MVERTQLKPRRTGASVIALLVGVGAVGVGLVAGSALASPTLPPAIDRTDRGLTIRPVADIYADPRQVTVTLSSQRARFACGWVIDVTANTGGDLRVMLVALTPLLGDGVVEMFRERDGSTSDVVVLGNTVAWKDEVWGELPAAPTTLETRPIGIVHGGVTASAGESVVIAFTGQDGVKTFGSPTGGFTTVNDGFTLPDGAEVTLSFAVMGDREGTFYEGPLAPDHSVPHGEGSPQSVAGEWVADQCQNS